MKKAAVLMALLLVVACGKKKDEEQAVKQQDVVIEEVATEEKTEEAMVEEVAKEEAIAEEVMEEKVEEPVEEEVEVVEEEKPYTYFIARSRLTGAIEDREPTEEKRSYQLSERAYMFTEVRDAGEENQISHKWYYIGKDDVPELMATVDLKVKGSRWRTWSSKELHIPGDWVVEVEDHLGNVLLREEMVVE